MIALIRGRHHDQRGMVSIFIVIFAALFMTIITVSFLSVMIHEQKQATQNNLSQNAYDSAMAGVEDAKRAIVQCQSNPGAPGCELINSSDTNCTILSAIGIGHQETTMGGNSEYPLQQSEVENSMNQAYTCVSINSKPGDYRADLNVDTPLVIPLRSNHPVDTISFKWQSTEDSAAKDAPVAGTDLLTYSDWRTDHHYPSVMRLQLVRLSGSMSFSDLDGSAVETAFLYPNRDIANVGATDVDFATDKRRDTPNILLPVNCDTTEYVCSANLSDDNKHMTQSGGDSLYLIMTPLYGNASVTLSLPGGANFQGLQAVVDSTGRADDLFRRVEARVDLIPHPVYPNAALSLKGSLCKNFVVTPSASGYSNNATSPGCSD